MSATLSLATSDTLGPDAYMVVKIVRWARFFGAASIFLTSSGLKITGSFFSYLGNGMRSIPT